MYLFGVNKVRILQMFAAITIRYVLQNVIQTNLKRDLSFLDAFTKLQKATISFMSVRTSAWNNNSAPTGPILKKPDIWAFFENMWRTFSLIKIQHK